MASGHEGLAFRVAGLRLRETDQDLSKLRRSFFGCLRAPEPSNSGSLASRTPLPGVANYSTGGAAACYERVALTLVGCGLGPSLEIGGCSILGGPG